jgi:hypothetical protein
MSAITRKKACQQSLTGFRWRSAREKAGPTLPRNRDKECETRNNTPNPKKGGIFFIAFAMPKKEKQGEKKH